MTIHRGIVTETSVLSPNLIRVTLGGPRVADFIEGRAPVKEDVETLLAT